jgi:hypothetical protein
MENIELIEIETRIYTIRGVQVMIDKDLAELYQVGTKVLNQSVKRNMDRFPAQFRFQLSDTEKTELVTNCDRFANLKHSSVNPYAFTEKGVALKNFSKKWFTFSKMNSGVGNMLNLLKIKTNE